MLSKEIKLFAITSLIAVSCLFVNGCSKNKMPETEHETPEVITQTEQKKDIFTVQSMIHDVGKKGSLSYEMISTDGSINKTGTYNFEDSGNAFHATDGNTEIYSDKTISGYAVDSLWNTDNETYCNIFSFAKDEAAELQEDTLINEIPCYHIKTSSDDIIASVNSIGAAYGLRDMVSGDAVYDYYINKTDGTILRVDISMPFIATVNENDINGEYTGSYLVSENLEAVNITFPTGLTQNADISTYTPGIIDMSKNIFINDYFDIQVPGNNTFVYDQNKTTELYEKYNASDSRYVEEAYAKSNKIILNVISTASEENSVSETLQNYLLESKASNILDADNFTTDGHIYACKTATINGEKTKSYCTEVNERCIIFTIYYKKDKTVTSFEKNFYSLSEDPFWTPEKWTLLDKYEVTTPKGYTLDKDNSSILFACMNSSLDEINIFALENTTKDDEIKKQSTSTSDTTIETVTNEVLTSDKGDVTYLVTHEIEKSYDYYTYVGLTSKGNDLIEFYIISTSPDKDYRDKFKELSSMVEEKPIKSEVETES